MVPPPPFPSLYSRGILFPVINFHFHSSAPFSRKERREKFSFPEKLLRTRPFRDTLCNGYGILNLFYSAENDAGLNVRNIERKGKKERKEKKRGREAFLFSSIPTREERRRGGRGTKSLYLMIVFVAHEYFIRCSRARCIF